MISPANARRLGELGILGKQIPCYGKVDMLEDNQGDLWELPTLSQLLEEVEKRGYAWEVSCDNSSADCFCFCYGCNWKMWEEPIWAASPEDAVALALIAILEGEG